MTGPRRDGQTGDTDFSENSAGGRALSEDHRWLTADVPDEDDPPPTVKVPHARTVRVPRARGPRARRD